MREETKIAFFRSLPELYLIAHLPVPKKYKKTLALMMLLRNHPSSGNFSYEEIKEVLQDSLRMDGNDRGKSGK